MQYQSKDGRNNTFFRDEYNQLKKAYIKDKEERTRRVDNTIFYDLGKRQKRPFFDIGEYQGFAHNQNYKHGTIWKDYKFKPYPDNMPEGLKPFYYQNHQCKTVKVGDYEYKVKDLYKKFGHKFSTEKH
jgi:hypothetical protein